MDNGMGGWLIYGRNFSDENFTFKYEGSGILLMVNVGLNMNGL